MAGKRKKTNFWKKIRFQYKLFILNENTLENVLSFRVSGLYALIAITCFAFLLIALTSVVIINTPIRNYLPGYVDSEIRKAIVDNALNVDSLERVGELQTYYLNNISAVFKGDSIIPPVLPPIDTLKYSEKILGKSKNEEAFRINYEEQEKYNLTSLPSSTIPENIIFFRPVRGIVSSRFDSKDKHFGVDIAASPKESVLATLNGTVIFTGFDANAGYIIQLQHKNSLVSIYKHNELLLKKEGEEVVSGEAIALAGTHLSFEIWFNGFPINPETVIVF